MTATQVIADRYEILSELGSGGFAVVYKVRDRMLNKEFALKMLKNEQASGEHLMRFQQEAMLVSKLNHPSISTVFHCGLTDENQPFLVMEFHDGKTLLEIIESDGPYDIQTAIDIFVQICDGMAYSHEQQAIIHRDLKTANMMIVTEGGVPNRVKILDFGLGKMTSSSAGVLTRPGMALGSPAYMSPEHAHGKQLDERSDIYSLGCIMFETLTGATPIRGHSQVDTIIKQISQPAPPMATMAKGKIKEFPPQLEKIVAKALEKEPAKRFQSMRELKEALLAINLNEKREPQMVAATMAKPVLFAIATVILGLVGWGTYVAFFAPIESVHDVKATRQAPKKSSDTNKKPNVVADVVGRLGTEGGVPGEVGPDAGRGTADGGATNLDEEQGMRTIEGGRAVAKTPVEGVMASGMFWDKLMSDEWNEWPWEGGVIWKKKLACQRRTCSRLPRCRVSVMSVSTPKDI